MEPLARFHTKDGKVINMDKDEDDILITTEDHRVIIPRATGQQTLDWISLFESLVEKVEYPE